MNQKISMLERGEILVVDDLPANLTLLTQLLSEEGYKVRVAPNGKLALKSVISNPPNLILLDIRMPDMDGYKVCEYLKSNTATKDIPVIFISALNEAMDKVKAFSAGGVDYITKPFEAVEVLARIKNQIHLCSLQKQLSQQNNQLQKEIEKRRETEEILFQSRALLASVLNCSIDGIAAMQAVRNNENAAINDFLCLVVNPVIAKAFGRKKEELIGKLVLKKLLDKLQPSLFEQFVKVVETGNNLEQDLHYEKEDKEYWYNVIAVKLGDGFAITVRDITERKQMELQLQQAHKQAQQLARTDVLTQVGNRLRFQEYLNQEWKYCLQQKQPLSIILCDIDCFKKYNDYYGHLAGDQCLTNVAQAIKKSLISPGGEIIRYGGEEFAVILPNCYVEAAIEVTQKIQQQINNLKIVHAGSEVNQYLTLSFGIVSAIPDNTSSPNVLINRADQALYKAKKRGRNCIVTI